MIRAAICCLGGFSSSYLANRLNDGFKKIGVEEEIHVTFSPMALLAEHLDEYDIAFCCPHLRTFAKTFVQEHNPPFPIYILPSRMYGSMDAQDYYEDGLDVIAGFKENPANNPFFFPGEENKIQLPRLHSYRRSKQK